MVKTVAVLPVVVAVALAQLGVGVGLGGVEVNQTLAPGGVYEIADLPVINTGSQSATFQLKANLVEGPVLAQREPPKVSNWFSFYPQSFQLAPNESKLVKVTLTLPFSAPAGEYEIFLEASPKISVEKGVAIGPAAATKLYFSVGEGSVLSAFQNRLATWVYLNPVIKLILAVVAVLLAAFIFRQNFNLKIDTRPRKQYHGDNHEPQ